MGMFFYLWVQYSWGRARFCVVSSGSIKMAPWPLTGTSGGTTSCLILSATWRRWRVTGSAHWYEHLNRCHWNWGGWNVSVWFSFSCGSSRCWISGSSSPSQMNFLKRRRRVDMCGGSWWLEPWLEPCLELGLPPWTDSKSSAKLVVWYRSGLFQSFIQDHR